MKCECSYADKQKRGYVWCAHPLHTGKFTLGKCMRICEHYDGPERTPERIQAVLRLSAKPKPRKAKPIAECIHRGEVLRDATADCCGKPRVKVHECAVHGECAISLPVIVRDPERRRLQRCMYCRDAVPPETVREDAR